MVESTGTGRRDRKRAATRRAIADAALTLFLERGFDRVSVSEVAEKADVATATLFNYFPNKESLVFDRDDDFDREIASAVREREPGTSVIDALRHHALTTWVPLTLDPALDARRALIDGTPALREYRDRSWLGHTHALAAVIADELARAHDDIASLALARTVLSIPALTAGRADVESSVRTVFGLISAGWEAAR